MDMTTTQILFVSLLKDVESNRKRKSAEVILRNGNGMRLFVSKTEESPLSNRQCLRNARFRAQLAVRTAKSFTKSLAIKMEVDSSEPGSSLINASFFFVTIKTKPITVVIDDDELGLENNNS